MVPKVALAAILQLLLNSVVSAGIIQREYNYSSFSDQPDLFLRAIHRSNAKSDPRASGHISGGIVTHHFLASELMVEYFETLAGSVKPQRVIIIGPDHSGRVPKGLAISDLKWKTPFGYLQPDRKAIHAIWKRLGLKDSNPEYFFGEHSIGILVPFVKYYFPYAKIVPVIVGEGISRDSLERLVRALGEVSDEEKVKLLAGAKALIVASEDEDFGITAVEAQAVGTPVIAIKQGGYLETVIPGKTGIFFENPDELIQILKSFSTTKYRAENCIKNAQKFSIERFKKEVLTLVDKYRLIYPPYGKRKSKSSS